MTLGNGVAESTQYNTRLQPCSMSAAGLLTLSFAYGAGDTGCSATNPDNNGNILKQTITPTVAQVGSFSQIYAYDEVNRLSSVQETTTSWQRTYHYDAFGNRAMRGAVSTPAEAPLCAEDDMSLGCSTQAGTTADKPGFVPASNRLTSDWAGYDPGGNLLSHKGPLGSGARQWSAAYDANNKQSQFCAGVSGPCTGTTATYQYDGQGNRVRKTTAEGSTTYVYDAFGKLSAEYSTTPPTSAGGRFFRTTDHLGSTRLVTNSEGACHVWQDFYPFGDRILGDASAGRQGWSCYGGAGTDPFAQQFTAKERDDESGLDYFLARYYASSLGRFTSVDPENAGALLSDPQSWNGYAYVNNRPLVLTDPDGRCPNCATGAAGFGIGFLVGAGVETFKQVKEGFDKGGRIQLDGNKILAMGVGTGIFGAAVGFTGGLSLAATAGVGATAGVAGGVVERSIDSDSSTAPVSTGDVTADALSGAVGAGAPAAVVKAFNSLPTAAAAKEAANRAGVAATEATKSVFPSLAPAAGKEATRQSAVVVSGVESATKTVVSQPVKQFTNSEAERLRKKEEEQ